MLNFLSITTGIEAHDWIALLSLIIAGVTCLFMLMGHKRELKHDYAEELEGRVAALELDKEVAMRRIRALEDQVDLLMREKIQLLSQLAKQR